MKNPYDKQIGGTHYKKMKIQPSKFVIENKLLFPEGNVIKYVCRHPYKDGKQDLEKAICSQSQTCLAVFSFFCNGFLQFVYRTVP